MFARQSCPTCPNGQCGQPQPSAPLFVNVPRFAPQPMPQACYAAADCPCTTCTCAAGSCPGGCPTTFTPAAARAFTGGRPYLFAPFGGRFRLFR